MERSVYRATILPATDNVPSYEIAVENDGRNGRRTSGRNQRQNRSDSRRGGCYRMRVTLIFCGVIMLLFGLSLLVTFSRTQEYQTELTQADIRFWDSMRLTGILLLISACLTTIVGLSAVKCNMLCNVTKRTRSSATESEPGTASYQDNSNSSSISGRSRWNIFGHVLGGLRRNWRQQSVWSTGRIEQTNTEMNRFPDEPPEYLEIIARDSQREMTIPPPPYT